MGRQELELLEVQDQARNQDLSCLPTVHVTDIPREMERKATRDTLVRDVKVQWSEAPTNGLTYFRAINTFKDLPDELRMLIPLFTDSIMRLGTKDKTMEQLEDLIKLKTGGVRASYFASTSPTDTHSYSEGMSFSGYALDHNVPAMYELLRTIIIETDFDNVEAESKIRQLLQADASGAADAIASSGHSYARRFAEAGLTPQGRLSEQIGGLTQVRHTAALAARTPSEGLSDVIQKLKVIQQCAISSSSTLRAALTCGSESVSSNEAALETFLSTLQSTTPAPLKSTSPSPASPLYPRTAKTFFPLPYQVYYTALSLPTVPYTSPHGAPLQILAQLLTHKHLHHEIREKGGAYGGGAYSRGLGGVFGFYSYRDPNPLNTMSIMQDAGRWACDRQWSDRDIEEAKLSVFQNLDAPESVSEEGMTRFLSGVDEGMEQERRERLLDVTEADVKGVAQRFLVEGAESGEGRLVVLGEKKDGMGFGKGDEWDVVEMGMAVAGSEAGSGDGAKDKDGGEGLVDGTNPSV